MLPNVSKFSGISTKLNPNFTHFRSLHKILLLFVLNWIKKIPRGCCDCAIQYHNLRLPRPRSFVKEAFVKPDREAWKFSTTLFKHWKAVMKSSNFYNFSLFYVPIKTSSANDLVNFTFRQLANWAGENIYSFVSGNDEVILADLYMRPDIKNDTDEISDCFEFCFCLHEKVISGQPENSCM